MTKTWGEKAADRIVELEAQLAEVVRERDVLRRLAEADVFAQRFPEERPTTPAMIRSAVQEKAPTCIVQIVNGPVGRECRIKSNILGDGAPHIDAGAAAELITHWLAEENRMFRQAPKTAFAAEAESLALRYWDANGINLSSLKTDLANHMRSAWARGYIAAMETTVPVRKRV